MKVEKNQTLFGEKNGTIAFQFLFFIVRERLLCVVESSGKGCTATNHITAVLSAELFTLRSKKL